MTGLARLAVSFERSQRARGLSPATVSLYRDTLGYFRRHVIEETGSDDIAGVTRRVITDYLAVKYETCAKNTVWTYEKVVRTFLRWCVTEDELPSSPMDRMPRARQVINPVPTFSDDDLSRLLKACEGHHWRDKRDMALMRLLVSTGARRGEVASLTPDGVDLDNGVLTVVGKTGQRLLPLSPKTVLALDRWMRVRTDTRTVFGLTPSGVYQTLKDRADRAGVTGWKTHRHRHDFFTRFLSNQQAASQRTSGEFGKGGEEGEAQVLGGWKSRELLSRYTASAAVQRAFAAHRRLNLDSRF